MTGAHPDTATLVEALRDDMLDQALEEALGSCRAPDVTARVVSRLREGGGAGIGLANAGEASAEPPRRRLWLAAALWLLATAVVGAVWHLGGGDPRTPAPANPEPAPERPIPERPAPQDPTHREPPLWLSETIVGTLGRTAAELRRLPEDTRFLRTVVTRERDFARLARFTKMERLRLMCLRKKRPVFDEKAMAALAGMRGLRRLELSQIDVTAGGLRALSKLPALSFLTIECGVWSPEAMAVLAELPALRILDCRFTQADDVRLAAVARIPALEKLDLNNCKSVTEKGLLAVAAIPTLRALGLRWIKPTSDEVIAALVKSNRVRELNLDSCEFVTEKGLVALTGMTSLRDLDLANLSLSGVVLDALPGGLERLRLDSCRGLDGAALAKLSRLRALHTLDLTRVAVPTERLLELLRVLRFRSLRVSGCKITSEVAAALSSHDGLRVLDLLGCSFEQEEDLQLLRRLRQLRRLTLSAPRGLTQRSLETIGRLSNLRYLDLGGWDELEEGLEHLAKLPLEDLILIGTGFADGDVREVAPHWPECRIRMPNEGFGIR